MELFKISELSFSYPGTERDVLKNMSLNINSGEFVLICGKSGCGKTTFLRFLKSAISPAGNLRGEIFFKDRNLKDIDNMTQTSEIGFVMQDPESQICTDKVWHEMAFGLESLGYSTREIRTRVSEMASFFGIQNLFHENTSDLSGGQKQLLNLASVMVLNPDVLVLDEPSGQLDPIAASEFFAMLKKINEELGTTIIISEHRLEEVMGISDRVIVMDDGRIISDTEPGKTGRILRDSGNEMYRSMPATVRAFEEMDGEGDCPLSVREGSIWMESLSGKVNLDPNQIIENEDPADRETVIEVKNAYFRYKKELEDVIRDFSIKVRKGELLTVMGGNGTGKTTALSLISGTNKANMGEVKIKGRKISSYRNVYDGLLGVLPQNPKSLFARKVLYLDLVDMLDKDISSEEKEKKILEMSRICRLDGLLESHPYDLSGGEQQRAALAMILMKNPEIILMDEPTKGMDGDFKRVFAGIIRDLKNRGVTILMVSHDMEFCAENADRCVLFFDGSITSIGTAREFFRGNRFYTTSVNRMCRKVLPEAVIVDDIMTAAGMKSCDNEDSNNPEDDDNGPGQMTESAGFSVKDLETTEPKRRLLQSIISGILCIMTFIVIKCELVSFTWSEYVFQGLMVLFAGLCIAGLIPQREISVIRIQSGNEEKTGIFRIAVTAFVVLIMIPLTIYSGIHFFNDRKYYFISALIMIEVLIPFFMAFEKRKPKAREIVLISTLCALGVAGRAAFFMLPEFKPVMAIVIIAGICFGGETGFLVGAVTAFVSNFIFGQGPWTPWQMFAFGTAGLIAGILVGNGIVRKTKLSISVFGFLITFVYYGIIMNMSSVFMFTGTPNMSMITTYLIAGIPMDLIHGISTVFFLWFIAEPMIEKLERIKLKYGMI